ncbi:MAG: hypothetical protein ABL930_02215 [Pseudobdellovibrio sp.]
MKTLILLAILTSLNFAHAEFNSYTTTVTDLSGDKKVLFNINATKKIVGDNLFLDVLALDQNQDIAIKENAQINKNTADIVEYNIVNNQTLETGEVLVKDKITIKYTDANNKITTKEILKPARLVAPANFELWIIRNFELLKKEKSLTVDFLIWDRLETLKFKVSYLGEIDLKGEKTQLFKMNIDNFLLATFITPIKIWFKADMSEIKLYKGRVAIRKKVNSKYEDLNADVVYSYSK